MNDKMKKVLAISTKVLTCALVAFTVFMMAFTVFTVATVDRNDRSVFGTKFYIVQTDSMSKSDKNADMEVHFNAGDIILVKTQKDNTALKEGDIISFMSANTDSYGETITHMIREVKKDSNGRVLGYVTFGTNTGANDEALVEPDFVLGKYAGKLPGLGNFFGFVKSTPGYIVCILIPFLLIILYNGLNVIRIFKQYKGEQTAAINAEKEQIAKDREANERMMAELLALKAKLEQKDAETEAKSAATEETAE